ncbi:MAG: signal peptidase I [Clostridia bacterium]|nr:signal peptidase I [Clostridia bacterium]
MMKNNNAKLETTYEIASVLLTAILAVGIIFTFFFKMSTVSGQSMENTLRNGDNLLITSITTQIKQGDVVVVSQPNGYEKVLIKRVIAVGGQTVTFDSKTGKTIIDGEIIDEPYIKEKARYTYSMSKTYVVPYGKIFVMGDNRNNSADSRDVAVGMIDENYVMGKVLYRLGDTSLFNSELKESKNG